MLDIKQSMHVKMDRTTVFYASWFMLGFVYYALTWGQMQYFGRSSRVIEGKSVELKDMTILLFTKKMGEGDIDLSCGH